MHTWTVIICSAPLQESQHRWVINPNCINNERITRAENNFVKKISLLWCRTRYLSVDLFTSFSFFFSFFCLIMSFCLFHLFMVGSGVLFESALFQLSKTLKQSKAMLMGCSCMYYKRFVHAMNCSPQTF